MSVSINVSRWHLIQFATLGLLWCGFYSTMLETVFELPWQSALIESLIVNAEIALLAFVSYKGIVYYRPSKDRFWFYVGVVIALGVLAVFIFGSILGLLSGTEYMNTESFEKHALIHGGVAFLIHAAVAGFAILKNDLKESGSVQKRQEESERMAREAELLKLRHQLQPHFLFNSLNSINALISVKPEQARSMIHQLSAFLRGTLKADDVKTIDLHSELEYMQLYLDIEKVRFGHRLKTRIEGEESCEKATLPALLLQPLMENAIKFGLYGTTGEVEIVMKAQVHEGMLIIQVVNPIDEDADSQSGTGFGLTSIRRRLQLIYGRNDLLETERTKNTFKATIKIPQSS